MEKLYEGAIKLLSMFMAMCLIKLLLPGGTMKRSASKAVDIAALFSIIKIISGVLPNG